MNICACVEAKAEDDATLSILSTRIMDVELEDCMYPIHGLNEAPLLSLEDALKYASDRSAKLSELDLSTAVYCADMHASNLVDEPGELLTRDEIAAIHLYTQDTPFYTLLNGCLRERNRELIKPFIPLIKLILTGLYKLPIISGGVVFRGVKGDISAAFKPTKIKMWWAFTSTTTQLSVLSNDLFLGKLGHRTQMFIHLSTGFDIHRYSAIDSEQEVLLPPGSAFRVDSSLSPAEGLFQVQMTQLPYMWLLKKA